MTNAHKILVYIPDVIRDRKKYTYEDFLDKIAHYAENTIMEFCPTVFDRCSSSDFYFYDENDEAYDDYVLLASEHQDWMVQELEETLEEQQREITYGITELRNTIGTDLAVLAQKLYSPQRGGLRLGSFEPLYRVSLFLSGEYHLDSGFYNTSAGTARLLPEDIETIKREPENWALVQFECHN